MKKMIFALAFSLVFLAPAQNKPEKLTFKSVIINGSPNIKALKKSIQLQTNLQVAILKLKFGKEKDATKLKEAQEQLVKTEAYHQKKYGLIPGLAYQLVNEKAAVSLLLNDDQLNKISGKPAASTKTDEKKKFKKYPQFELKTTKEVQSFMMAAQQGTLLKNKVDQLKKDRTKKSIKEQKRILEELKKAEAKKDEFDAAMNKKYGVRANLDYLLEITSVSLFLVLDKSDLSDIAKKQQSRTEAAFKKALNAK
jgi:hypothetical protein